MVSVTADCAALATGKLPKYAGSSLVFCEKPRAGHEAAPAVLPSLLKCKTGENEVLLIFKTALETKTSPVLARVMPVRLEKAGELGINVVEKESELGKPANAARKTLLLPVSTTSGSPTYFCVIALGAAGIPELTDEGVAKGTVVVTVGNATFATGPPALNR